MSNRGAERYEEIEAPTAYDVWRSFFGERNEAAPGVESDGYVYYSYPGNHRVAFLHNSPIAIFDEGKKSVICESETFLRLFVPSQVWVFLANNGIHIQSDTGLFHELYRQLSMQQMFFEDT